MAKQITLLVYKGKYITVVCGYPLTDASGKECRATYDPNQNQILISASLSPEERAAEWQRVGEAIYKAEDSEDTLDDVALLEHRRRVATQLYNQGGAKALGELPALAEPERPAVLPVASMTPRRPVVIPEETMKLIRRQRFGFLTDPLFAMARAKWEAMNLSPLHDDFGVVVDRQNGKPNVVLTLRLKAYRKIALRTGQYGGFDHVEYDFNEDNWPETCYVTVYRYINPQTKIAVVGEAHWEECYGWDSAFWDPVVARRPKTCLRSCAEADALRRAFPEELGESLVDDELRSSAKRPEIDARDIRRRAEG